MASKKNNKKKFKVYYYTGDYFSAKGEEQHTMIVEADDEVDAERTFKHFYSQPGYSFGWVERIKR